MLLVFKKKMLISFLLMPHSHLWRIRCFVVCFSFLIHFSNPNQKPCIFSTLWYRPFQPERKQLFNLAIFNLFQLVTYWARCQKFSRHQVLPTDFIIYKSMSIKIVYKSLALFERTGTLVKKKTTFLEMICVD